MLGEPGDLISTEFFVAIFVWLAVLPVVASVVTGAVAGWWFRVKWRVGLLMGFGVGILNPLLGLLFLWAFLWVYRKNVHDPSFEGVVPGAIVFHTVGIVLGCAFLVLLLYAMGRASKKAS